MFSQRTLSQKKVTKKSHILQFLPKILEDLSKNPNFEYKGKRLKSSYVIDILHNLILKYYFKKENKFPLYSMILRDKYGQYYNYYMNFLLEKKIIHLEKNHRKGKSSKIYSINTEILKSEIGRFINSDKVIVKKYNSKLESSASEESKSPISIDVRNKIIRDLYDFKIDYDGAMNFIEKTILDPDSVNRNLYSVQSIKNGNLFFHFDKFGRFHTNFTILKSEIRKNFLTIDGSRTYEIDIKNSQPLFLSKLIKIVNTKWVKNDELELFSSLVENGEFYGYLSNKLNLTGKEESKKLVYKVFFGQNRKGSIDDEKFISLFPTIHNFIKLYKRENSDYRSLSHHLQRMESDLIFNKIIRRLMISNPDVKILTIHDSMIVSEDNKEIVNRILLEEMSDI